MSLKRRVRAAARCEARPDPACTQCGPKFNSVLALENYTPESGSQKGTQPFGFGFVTLAKRLSPTRFSELVFLVQVRGGDLPDAAD
jgi:hypothetical protein